MTEQDLKVLKELNGDTKNGMSQSDELVKSLVKLRKMGYISSGGYPYVTEDGKEYLREQQA